MPYIIRLQRRNHNIRVKHVLRTIKLKHGGLRGAPGPQGTVEIGTTTTLAPETPATVSNTGTPGAAILNFGIPQGKQGEPGPTGISTFVRVHHGSNANIARPNALFVEWVGTVAPNNGTVEDTWIDTN